MSREDCRRRAPNYVDSGALVHDLARLVARPSVSQLEGRLEDLHTYLCDDIGPLLRRYGLETAIHENPSLGGPPIMIAQHVKDEALPTWMESFPR